MTTAAEFKREIEPYTTSGYFRGVGGAAKIYKPRGV